MSKFFVCLGIFLPFILFSQNHECSADELRQLHFQKDNTCHQAYEQMEARILQFFTAKQQANQAQNGNLLTAVEPLVIPVVVHIIHNNGPENISDSVVIEAIQFLNDGFSQAGYFANGNGVDVGIQFCLAQRDPDGNFTTGINRVVSPLTNSATAQGNELKDLIRWNTFDYLNIWVVSGGGGYANFPWAHGMVFDGIVIGATALASAGSATLNHEVGHYLALYHTFDNGCENDDCLLNGDRVCDTPPDNSTVAHYCDTAVNSCSTDTDSGFDTDQNDQIWNYMDYGASSCKNGFTQGQTDRMRYALEFERTSLLSSKGCQTPCFTPITGGFAYSPTVPQVGETVTFINNTENATAFQWLVNGVPTSNEVDFNTSFSLQGNYSVSLLVSNNDSLCDEAYTLEVEVICPANAAFTVSDSVTLAGKTVTFSNTSTNPGGTYQWLVNGVPFATSTNASYVLPTDGDFVISLVAQTASQSCRDTTSLTVQAVCIDADFMASDYYPPPGQFVGFTNKSEGATSFVWTINGDAVSTSTDLVYAFPASGVYEVCMEASNPFCGDTNCKEIYAFEEYDGGCAGTYLKQLTPFNSSWGYCSASAPDGSIFMGGSYNNSAVLAKVNTEGEVIWSRTFEHFDADEYITHIYFDSEGMALLLGLGYDYGQSSPLDFFVMKYDPENDNVLWTRIWDNITAQHTLEAIIEKSNGGNYVAVGNLLNDQIYLELDRNTGAKVVEGHYNAGSIDHFNDAVAHNGEAYVAGTQALSTSIASNRACITKFDVTGTRLWTRIYANAPSQTSGSLFEQILIDNDTLVAFGNGNITNISGQGQALLFAKTDLDGNLYWGKSYTIEGENVLALKMLALPDGYLLFGQPYLFGYHILRIDKQGNLIWAKRFDTPVGVYYDFAALQNGFVHFTGYGGFIVGKMSLDGVIAGEDCATIIDVAVTVSDLPNNDGMPQLQMLSKSIPFQTANIAWRPAFFTTAYYNSCGCEEPVDSCYFAADAVLTNLSAACNGDSLTVNFTIYNNGNGDLVAGTPVSFYDADPSVGPATLLKTVPLPNAIAAATSGSFQSFIAPLINTPIFVMVNDAATIPAPWPLLDSFPNASTYECYFQNNLRSFQVNFSPPVLDLGPDVAICDAGTATFQAQPGFVSYEWFDGNPEASYTVWQPGIYWVTTQDACGGIQIDSVSMSIIPSTVADLGPDTLRICRGEQLTFNLSGFDHYLWQPSSLVDCDDCDSVNVGTMQSGGLFVLASTNDGCFSSDSVWLEVLPLDTVYQNMLLCEGDTVFVFGNPVTEAGVISALFVGFDGCDSMQVVSVTTTPAINLSYISTEQVVGFSNGTIALTATGGTGTLHYNWGHTALDTNYLDGLDAGTYSVTVSDINGCEATAQIVVWLGTSTSDNSYIEQCLLGPNPTSGKLSVHLKLFHPATVGLEILDPIGRVVRTVPAKQGLELTWELDMTALASSVYYCKLNVDGKPGVYSFVKQ